MSLRILTKTQVQVCVSLESLYSLDRTWYFLRVPTKLHKYNCMSIHSKSIGAKFQYLRAHLREKARFRQEAEAPHTIDGGTP